MSFFILTLIYTHVAFALEQIANGNFSANLNPATNWSDDNQISQPDPMNEWGRINAAGYDAGNGYFHAKFVPAGGSDNLFYYADGAIWQDFPPIAKASDTNAYISYGLREIYTVNGGKSWTANMSGTIRRQDAPDTIINTFLNLQNNGNAAQNPGWTGETGLSTILPGGNRYRFYLYWNLGGQKNTTLTIDVDGIHCNISPSGLTASETTSGGCDLDWHDSSSSVVTFSAYRVYRSLAADGPWTQIATISAPATNSNYTDATPPAADAVYYAVADVDSAGVVSPLSPVAVFKTAKLVITRVEAVPTTVTIGQSGIPVKVYVSNTGYSPAQLSEIDLYFSNPAIGVYNKTLQTALPVNIAGGASTTVTFSVDILDGSIPDTDVIDATATGTNIQIVPARTIVATSSLQTHSWLIRSPANLVVQKITTPTTVYRAQKDVSIAVEVVNDGNKNAAAYWDSTALKFNLGSYENIRLVDTLPVAVYPGLPVTIHYLVDVSPLSATGTCVIDADITFRDVNLLTPSTNYDGATETGIWTVVAGVMKTYQGPPKFPSYIIESNSFNQGNTIVYAKTENLQPLAEQRFRWYNPSGTLVRVTDPPLTTDENGVMTDQLSLDAASPLGLWRVIATRVIDNIPLAEKQFYVVTPAAISIQHQLPGTVTLNQTFTATSTIINAGGAAVTDAFPAVLTNLTPNASLISGPIPETSSIDGLGQTTFNWQFSATAVGSFEVEGAGYGYDLNDSTSLTAATQTSNVCIIQSQPVLSIVSLSETYGNVYRNQTGLTVAMLIRNQGEASVYVDSASLSFGNGTHHQTVTNPTTSPFLLAGNSDVSVTFTVSVDADSATGAVNASASFTAYEANNPASTSTTVCAPVYFWTILSAVGQCAGNTEYNPEQYTFNQGQKVYVKFTGMAAPGGGNAYQIWVYDANNVKQASPIQSGIGVSNHSFTLPAAAALGKWRAEIHIVKSPGGNDQSLEGVQYFEVQAPGTLAGSLTIASTSVPLGDEIALTLSLSNNVATSSTIYPVIPVLPIRAPTYTGAADTLISGPTPASVSVSFGKPATFTWVFKTTDFTDIGSSFAMEVAASGIDLNTTYAETQRTVSLASTTSNNIQILLRDLEVQPDPIQIAPMVCGTTVSWPFQLKNTGNTHLKNVFWQKAYPTSPSGAKIPYAYFDFTPTSGFSVATGTLSTACSFDLSIPYNQPAGTYTAIMAVYDDLSGNSARDLGEPYYEFTVQAVASECKVVYTDTNLIELGGYPIDSNTATVTINIFNGGNLNLTNLKFKQTDQTFVNSYVTIAPNPLGALATDGVEIASISAYVGADAVGEHIATFTLWEDTSNPDVIDAGEASCTFMVRFSVGTKDFNITDNPKDLGNATPTFTLTDFNVTITNVGTLDIVKPAVELSDLTQGAYSISKDYLTIEMPPGPILPGAGNAKVATISLYIPAGTPVGVFSGIQTVYDDENADEINNGTANEVAKTFELKVTINPYYSVQVIPATVDLGGVAPGDPPKSVGFLCRNAGNTNLSNLGWQETTLFDNALQITDDRYAIEPAAFFLAGFGQTFNATLTIELLATQDPGLYSGTPARLFDSAVISASDTFTITCQVGSKALDIIESGPLLATGTPNSTSTSVSYRIKNTGSLILAKPRAIATGNLTDGASSMPAASCIFTPATFDYLSPGQIKTGQVAVQIPAGQTIGTYTGTIRVWDDTDNDFSPDPTEASDTVSIEVRVTGKRVLTVTPNPADLFFIPAGQSGTIDLTLKNSGNIPINNPAEIIKVMKFPLNPVAPGPPSISETQITFNSPLAGSLAVGQTATITVSVTVPVGQTAGPYEGYQIIYDDYQPQNNAFDVGAEESHNLLLKLTVGEKKLSVTTPVNMGSGDPSIPGTPSVLNKSFEIKNLTSIPLSKLKWAKTALVSGASTLPTSAFSFLPAGPFNVSSNGTKATSASMTVPMYQSPGTYSGTQTVFEDEDSDGTIDSGEASGTFVLSVTVNTLEKIEILPSIADLGDVKPGESTVPFDLTINNIGNVDIAGLDAQWVKTNLAGPETINSSLISFSAIPDPLVVAASTICQVTVGPLDSPMANGLYTGIQSLKGQNCELQLSILSAATGPDLASGSIYQEIATTSFSALAPETMIFSAFVTATGTAAIGFLETLPDKSTASYREVSFDFQSKTLTQSGPGIIDAGAMDIARQNDQAWYRLYFAFTYQFVESSASHTFIVLKNATPDATVTVASYSVLFDGIQLEKAVIPGQTKPTAYGDKGKLISPSEGTSLDGKTQYYEW